MLRLHTIQSFPTLALDCSAHGLAPIEHSVPHIAKRRKHFSASFNAFPLIQHRPPLTASKRTPSLRTGPQRVAEFDLTDTIAEKAS